MTGELTKDIVRVVLFVLAWINSILVANGHKTLPVIDESQVYWVITFIISVWAMVKEAPFKKMFAKTTSEAPVAPKVYTPSINPAPVQDAPKAPEATPEEPKAPEQTPAEAPTAEAAPTQEEPKTN